MKTSIIILTYNQLEYTRQCIESIRTYTAAGGYELIIVDAGSTDGTIDWLKQQEELQVLYNEDKVGFIQGYNQGMRQAAGDQILLLRNDAVVTANWLVNLLECLYSSAAVGAVGPMTNQGGNGQAAAANYQNLTEMQVFAQFYNQVIDRNWEERLKLLDFCLLIKKEVVDKVGYFDETLSPLGFEDDDYSFRIRLAGYKLLLSKNTFIHTAGSIPFVAAAENRAKFMAKWGFDPTYSSLIRHDIINLMDKPHDQPIKVLDIGCACGGTLLQIKNIYPQADTSGIEFNEQAAASASLFADVIAADVEQTRLPYPQEHFDYIILADVLEHLKDPWQALANLRPYLKADGQILASIPNVTHFTVLRSLLQGNWHYEAAGILDRTHLRFFTLPEIVKLFHQAEYGIIQYLPLRIYESAADQAFIQQLAVVSKNPHLSEQVRAYQYLVKAVKAPAAGVLTAHPVMELQKLIFLLRRIEQNIQPEENLQVLFSYLNNRHASPDQIVQAVLIGLTNPSESLLKLTFDCIKHGYRQYAQTILDLAQAISPGSMNTGLQCLRDILKGANPAESQKTEVNHES